ncbi:SMP-30/gluconolactonase/LRE family protein [Nocardia sp. NPDC006044]|uniref:SMP-30/gluconolactonase/LRE family protein n=1 Tax=Nocardia sp. NPDC006044 TaxID=3364306 RepID=UPI0036AEF971
MPALRLLALPSPGAEHVVLAPDGRLVTGAADGSVFAVDPADGRVEKIGETGGRLLGLFANPDGSLLVCHTERGLLRLDKPHGTVEVLVGQVDGQPLSITSGVWQVPDGTIYFSSSTTRYPFEQHMADYFEGSHTGRLFRRTPDGTVETLLDELKFASGVLVTPDQSCVLVAESAGYRITRYWLTGPKQGTCDYLVDNLAGLPYNLSVGSDGLLWVALVAPRSRLLDFLLPRPGIFRRLLRALPRSARPHAAQTAWVQAYDVTGTLVHDLQRAGDDYAKITGVVEHHRTLYLSSVVGKALAITQLPE